MYLYVEVGLNLTYKDIMMVALNVLYNEAVLAVCYWLESIQLSLEVLSV